MKWHDVPMVVWMICIASILFMASVGPLIAGAVMLLFDQTLNTGFFDPDQGGDPVLWQHLFWFFGHPEVYVMLLPGIGMISLIVATFARRPTAGYPLLVTAFILIGVISFTVWVHHMFVSGAGSSHSNAFSGTSMSIAIPSGIQIFSVIATLWYGRLRLSVPLLFVLGFVFVFVLGGVTGVQLASIPFDWQAHDTYYLIAHFHYVLLGGVVLPFLGGVYYWFPKLTGRMLDDRLGVVSFALVFAGVNLTFFPMHLAGLNGMPRRVYTYPEGLGWDGPQAIATVGAFTIALGLLAYAANVVVGLTRGRLAGTNPWAAGTLEWLADSPPADHNFSGTPVVKSRYPLWEEEPELVHAYVSHDRRETVETTALGAEPEVRSIEPGPSVVPLVASTGTAVAFVGLIFDPIWAAFGLAILGLALVRWFMPQKEDWDLTRMSRGTTALPTSWTAESTGVTPPIVHGMWGLLLVLGVVLATLESSYFYLRSSADAWPLGGLEPHPFVLAIPAVLLTGLAALAFVLARRSVRGLAFGPPAAWLGAGALLLLASLALMAVDHRRLDYNWATNATGSAEWALTFFLALLMLALVVAALAAAFYAWRGFFTDERFTALTAVALFGSFIALAWIPVFLTVYVTPQL
jgi:cytochrome c oxidase subunit 1/cytochrome c oxidase subunit I+III